MHVYMHMYINACIHMYTHIYMYTYIYIYKHINIYIYIYISVDVRTPAASACTTWPFWLSGVLRLSLPPLALPSSAFHCEIKAH